MRVILSSYTPDPTLAIARAAKTCYSDGDYEVVTGKVEDKDSREKMIKNIIDSGHGSCLEHAVFTFFVEGISRACTHQLVRHRIASYEQRSQRYVNEGEFDYVIPDSVFKGAATLPVFLDMMKNIKTTYDVLVKWGVPEEDARYVLPNACTSTIVITMNLRSLRNFFELRMCNRAQWEIQELAEKMHDLVEEVDPILVYRSGPKCVTSECTEKKRTSRCPYKHGYHATGTLSKDLFYVAKDDKEVEEEPKTHIDFTPNANIDPNEWWDKWNKGVAEEDEDDVESPDFGKIDMSKFMKGSVLIPDSNKNG